MTQELRPGEVVLEDLPPPDAGVIFIGRIRTPWRERTDCPRQGRLDGPVCRIELDARFAPAIEGIAPGAKLEVLTWLHLSRRDLLRQSPKNDGATRATFALRSPIRPNPIGTSIVEVVGVEPAALLVRGLDCVDGTPLLDLKPERGSYRPEAPPQPGDAHTG